MATDFYFGHSSQGCKGYRWSSPWCSNFRSWQDSSRLNSVMGYAMLELSIEQSSKCDIAGLKPTKRLMSTSFGNSYTPIWLSEFLGHMYESWGWDWSIALIKLSKHNVTMIATFFWCMGLIELKCITWTRINSPKDIQQKIFIWLTLEI